VSRSHVAGSTKPPQFENDNAETIVATAMSGLASCPRKYSECKVPTTTTGLPLDDDLVVREHSAR
jgi:hypothetical protein